MPAALHSCATVDTKSPRNSARSAGRPRTRRRRRRFAALGAFGLVALGIGLVIGANHVGSGEKSARRFAVAWNRGDYKAMYAELTPDAAAATGESAFENDYRSAMATATATAIQVGKPAKQGGDFVVPVVYTTRVFGPVHGQVTLPVGKSGGGKAIAWRSDLVFPGLRPDVHLRSVVEMPPRATILARDGTILAKGDTRASKVPDVSAQVVGELGGIPATQLAAYQERGIPTGTKVGSTGLERIFDRRLLGTPGGTLLAGSTVLAHTKPQQSHALRTTISIPLERAATTALGNRLGGVVAIRPKTGEVLAFAGIAFSSLQPPGSTFKIITTTAALADGAAKPSSVFPYASYATLSGVKLNNANGENCGGTLALAFAVSCNSVFAPLGAKLGAKKLVSMAERFGFNSPAGILGAAESSLPEADQIGDDLAVGSSAIGQGKVQATTLQMGLVAATIALKGKRPRPTLVWHAHPKAAPTTEVTSAHTAHQVKQLMIGVVREGTGTQAAIPGVTVAGKTGTAELQSTQPCTPAQIPPGSTAPANPETCTVNSNDPTLTDAWFTAFAPASAPKIAVCVMLVRDGQGGETAAPAARGVIQTGLEN
jgi:penicillin-binding protein A